MQNRALRLQVESFHIQQASIAGCHQHRNPTVAGALPQDGLHIQRIAFVNDDVEPVEEFFDSVGCHPNAQNPDLQVRVDFRDSAGSHLGFVQPDVQYGRRHSVEIGQLNAIEIRQPKLAAHALRCQGVCDDMPDTQTNNADAQPAKPCLFLCGDHVAVAVQPHRPKRPRA